MHVYNGPFMFRPFMWLKHVGFHCVYKPILINLRSFVCTIILSISSCVCTYMPQAFTFLIYQSSRHKPHKI